VGGLDNLGVADRRCLRPAPCPYASASGIDGIDSMVAVTAFSARYGVFDAAIDEALGRRRLRTVGSYVGHGG
jgi:hypothetical protein